MSKLIELRNQMAALEAEIQKLLEEEKPAAIARVRVVVEEFGLTENDIFGKPAKVRPPVLAKYRDPATGNTWSGRGKPPAWIAGKDRAAFAI